MRACGIAIYAAAFLALAAAEGVARDSEGVARDSVAPQLISYQGFLEVDGEPAPTGEYELSFRIYDDPTLPECSQTGQQTQTRQQNCARLVWGPQVFDAVPVVRGYFNVLLGPKDVYNAPISAAFKSSERFLDVESEGTPSTRPTPLTRPRQQIYSTPFALFALASLGEVPIGGIIPYAGLSEDLPDNWRICDGGLVDDPSSPYHDKEVPNLVGRFVRGTADPEQVRVSGGSDSHNHEINLDRDSTYTVNEESRPMVCMGHDDVPGRCDAVCLLDDGTYGLTYVEDDTEKCRANRLPKLVFAGNFDIEIAYQNALVVGDNGRSHDHIISGSTKSWDSRPSHMRLYYIIRIK